MALAITGKDRTACELRAVSAKCKDAKAARRMLAIAMVLEGYDRKTAAKTCGMDRQTLRDWVHRYNAEGPEGLSNRRSSGRALRMTPEQKITFADWVRAGPDLAKDGVVRWRRIDLQRKIEADFGVVMHERTVGKQLAALDFRRLSVRPQHPKSDPEAQETFKKNFAAKVEEVLPDHARGKPLEVWYQDEARVGQQGTLTRVWAKRGTRPRAPRDTRYVSAYLFGAVCPARAVTAALVMPHANTEAMNAHLLEISRTVAPGAHAIIVLDGAGWHGSNALELPDNISFLALPPLCPGTQSSRKHLGLSACQQARYLGLRDLRSDR